jgi:hypothetical protein
MACEESHLPIYMIANLQSLKELCTYLPLNKKELVKISGFGKAKAEKYGDEILEAIESYCSRNHIGSNMEALPAHAKKEVKEKTAVSARPDTKLVSLELFRSGKSMQEIALERNYSLSTIEGHLAHYVETGELHVQDLLDDEMQLQIAKVMSENSGATLQRLKELLPASGYGQIKMMVAAEKFSAQGS